MRWEAGKDEKLREVFCVLRRVVLWLRLREQATNYSDRVFFENSSSQRAHYYSSTRISSPSALSVVNDKLPVETEHFLSAPNSLKLQWTSRANGGWEAEVHAYLGPDDTILDETALRRRFS